MTTMKEFWHSLSEEQKAMVRQAIAESDRLIMSAECLKRLVDAKPWSLGGKT